MKDPTRSENQLKGRMSQGNKAVDSEILKSGIAQLTGATDIEGRCIITFPVASAVLLDTVTPGRLVHLLEYYCSLLLPVDQVKGLSLLICLQHATHPGIQVWLQAMETVQKTTSESITIVYLIKPKSKDKSRLLKKQLGLKEKFSSTIPILFKVVWLEKIKEVYNYIDPSQLTEDYGGFLKYSHKAWVLYQMSIGSLLKKCYELEKKIPTSQDQLQLLREYDMRDGDMKELTLMVQQVEEKFHGIMKNLNMETIIDECKKTMASLEHPEIDSVLSLMAAPILVSNKAELYRLHTYFVHSKKTMSRIWQEINDQLQHILQIDQCQQDATQLCDEIKKYEELMEQHIKPCRSHSEVDACFNHFQSSLYTPAKEIVEKATDILQTIQAIKPSNHPQFLTSEFLSEFTFCVKTFANRLEDIHHQYSEIQHLFLVLNKCISWYQKVLLYLPLSLKEKLRGKKTSRTLKYTNSSSDSMYSVSSASSSIERSNSKLMPIPQNWANLVSNIHSRYPSPKKEHLSSLYENIPETIAGEIRTKSSLVFYRIQVLLKLLQKSIFRGSELKLALKWKEALMKGKDEIVNDIPGRKSLEFSELPKVVPKTQNFQDKKSSMNSPIDVVMEPQLSKAVVITSNISKTDVTKTEVTAADVTKTEVTATDVTTPDVPKSDVTATTDGVISTNPRTDATDVLSPDVKSQIKYNPIDPPDYTTTMQRIYGTYDSNKEYFVSLSFSSEATSSLESQDEGLGDATPIFSEILSPERYFPVHQTYTKSSASKSKINKNILPNNLKKSKKYVSVPSSLTNGFDASNNPQNMVKSTANLCYSANHLIKNQIFHETIVKQIQEVTLSNMPSNTKLDIVSNLLNSHPAMSSSSSSYRSHRSYKTWHENILSSESSSGEVFNLDGIGGAITSVKPQYSSLPRLHQIKSSSSKVPSSITGNNRTKGKRPKLSKTKINQFSHRTNDQSNALTKQHSKSLMNLRGYCDDDDDDDGDDLTDDTAPHHDDYSSIRTTNLKDLEPRLNATSLQDCTATQVPQCYNIPVMSDDNDRQFLLTPPPQCNKDYINKWINLSCNPATSPEFTEDLVPAASLSDTGYISNRLQNDSSEEYEEFDSILVELQQDEVQSTLERTEKILLEQERLLQSELLSEDNQDSEADEVLSQKSGPASVANSNH